RALLTIGASARPLIAGWLKLAQSEFKRLRLAVPATIDHHIAICELRLAFELAGEASSLFALEEWISEREWKEAPLHLTDPSTDVRRNVSPDGSFVLALRRDGTRQTCYLEMDRASIAPGRLAQRLRCYLSLAKTERPAPIFIVTTSQNRQATIGRLALD